MWVWALFVSRIQQLEKLRENYQNNSQRIRDNYSMQVVSFPLFFCVQVVSSHFVGTYFCSSDLFLFSFSQYLDVQALSSTVLRAQFRPPPGRPLFGGSPAGPSSVAAPSSSVAAVPLSSVAVPSSSVAVGRRAASSSVAGRLAASPAPLAEQ